METGKGKKVAIVTGGRSGIGHGIAVQLEKDGYSVYVPGRKPFESDSLTFLQADITDEEQVKRAVQTVIDREGRVDLLVNCAGASLLSITEFTSREDAGKQMDILFGGTDNMTRAVLPYMRRQRSGRILNVSSMAALASLPFQSYYSAAKAAVNAYTDALRSEIRPFGIECAVVLPGDVKTGLTAARHRVFDGDEEYGGRVTKAMSRQDRYETIEGADAMRVGSKIAGIAQRRKLNGTHTLDAVSCLEAVLIKFLPRTISNYIVGRMYGEWETK